MKQNIPVPNQTPLYMRITWHSFKDDRLKLFGPGYPVLAHDLHPRSVGGFVLSRASAVGRVIAGSGDGGEADCGRRLGKAAAAARGGIEEGV